ncbi:hypothetical protein AVEN_160052-1, partial [Araneus ventricosus]
ALRRTQIKIRFKTEIIDISQNSRDEKYTQPAHTVAFKSFLETRWHGDMVSPSASEGFRFETRFYQKSALYGRLARAKSDIEGQMPSGWCG